MEEYYGSNKEYLQDCIKLVEMMVKEASGNARIKPVLLKTEEGAENKPQEETSAEFSARIKKTAEESIKRKIKVPLEEIAAKNGLNEDERTIMIILAYSEATYKNEYQDPKKVLELLSLGRPEKTVDFWHYFKPGSRLEKKKIILALDNDVMYRFIGIRLRPQVVLRILGQRYKKIKIKRKRNRLPVIENPGVLYGKLNDYIIGQDSAKKMLSTAIYQHLQKIKANEKRSAVDKIEKSNIFLIGPTGVGKTYLCRNIANILSLPIAFCDATQYTESGYVGSDVEEMLVKLMKNANFDRKAAEQGIIYIDEIDKIAGSDPGGNHYAGNRDVSGASVQQELLKMLEGEEIHYGGRNFHSHPIEINVRNVLFIVSGAFVGLEKIIAKRLGVSKQIGFSAAGEKGANETRPGSLLRYVEPEDLVKYGFLPEFVGRFPVVVAMDDLKKEDLVAIMTKPKNAIVKQYKYLFRKSGFNLEIPQETLETIAEQALQRRIGARGLRSIMESALSPMLFERLNESQPRKVNLVLEKEIVEGIVARVEEKAG